MNKKNPDNRQPGDSWTATSYAVDRVAYAEAGGAKKYYWTHAFSRPSLEEARHSIEERQSKKPIVPHTKYTYRIRLVETKSTIIE